MLVVGATGRVGRVLVRKLVLRGYRVRAMIRKGSSSVGGEGFPRSVEVIEGDVTDYESCRTACTGVDKVASASSHAALCVRLPCIVHCSAGGRSDFCTSEMSGKVSTHLVLSMHLAGRFVGKARPWDLWYSWYSPCADSSLQLPDTSLGMICITKLVEGAQRWPMPFVKTLLRLPFRQSHPQEPSLLSLHEAAAANSAAAAAAVSSAWMLIVSANITLILICRHNVKKISHHL